MLACRNYLVIERYAEYIDTLPFDTYNPGNEAKMFSVNSGVGGCETCRQATHVSESMALGVNMLFLYTYHLLTCIKVV